MDIRIATINDSKQIGLIIRSVAKASFLYTFSRSGQIEFLKHHTAYGIGKMIKQNTVFHIGLMNQQFIGVVGIRDMTHLSHLFITPAYQGNGFARSLWQVAKSSAMQSDHNGQFTVNASQKGIGVYKSFGFYPAGKISNRNGIISYPMRLTPDSI